MSKKNRSRTPPELRGIFGQNLKRLATRYPSVSALCTELDINRTQFNRYLAGESFPRPDVLDRMCKFFDVDARILLTPLSELEAKGDGVLSHPFIADWLGPDVTNVPEDYFPSGFYRFSRHGFLDPSRFLQGLVYIRRQDGHTFLRGLEPREAMRQQGLPQSIRQREFRGVVMRQDDGISILISRQGGKTGTFNFLAPVASYENNFWQGYVTRTVRSQPTGRRISRMVYEYLGKQTRAILGTARNAGYCDAEALLAHHLRLLQVDQPLT